MDEDPTASHHKNAAIKIQVSSSESDRNHEYSTMGSNQNDKMHGVDDLDNAAFQPPPTFSIQDEKVAADKSKKRNESPQSSNSDHMDDRHLLNGNHLHENDSLPSYTSNDTIPNYENVQRNDNMQSYESTQNLTQISTPKSRRNNHDTFIGIDNPAFHNEEMSNGHGKRKDNDASRPGDDKKANHEANGQNGGAANTTISLGLTSPTKAPDSKVPEAVNLELVNMAPLSKTNGKSMDNNGGLPPNVQGLNSIPMKKDTEVDLGGEKYDEYFVPVNEHRKYMRGEKLIVTMDKRTGKMTWKGWIWWGIGAILLLAIILAILAGAGVIGNDNPIVAPHDNFTESQARSFDGEIKGSGFFVPGLDKGKSSSTTTSTTTSTTESATEGFTDFEGGWDKDSKEVSFTPSPSTAPPLLPPSTDSSMYYVPKVVEGELKIENSQWDDNFANPESDEFKIMAASLEKDLKETIFDYQTLNFGGNNITIKVVGLEKGSVIVKYRIVWEEKPGIRGAPDPINEASLKEKVTRQIHANFGYLGDHKIDMNSITGSRVLDKCQFNKNGCQFDCLFDKSTMDFSCTCPPYLKLHPEGKVCITESEPEPAAEPKPEPGPESTSEPSAEPEPEPTSEPSAEPAAEPTSEPAPEPKSEPSAEPVAEPTSEPAPEPKSEPAAEPSAEPAAEPTSEPAAEPEPKSEPAAEPAAEPTAEPAAEPTTEPAAEPSVILKSESKSESSAEPSAEPTAEPAAEPTAEPAAEPTAEPAAEPEPSSDIKPVGEHTSTESTSETSSKTTVVLTEEHKVSKDTASEPRVLTVMVHPVTTVETITEKSDEVSPEPEPGVTTVKYIDSSSTEKMMTETTSHHSNMESEMTTKAIDPKSIEAIIVQNAIEKAKAENVTEDSDGAMSVLPLHKMATVETDRKMDDDHMNENKTEYKETIESTTMTHPMLALPEDTYDEKHQSQGRFFSEDETAGIDHSNIHPGFLPEHIHSEPILPEAEYTVTENDILDVFTPEMHKTTTETNDYLIQHTMNGTNELTVSVSKPAPVWEANESEDKIISSQRDNRVIFSSIPLNTTKIIRNENTENATNPTVLAVPDNTVFSNPPSVEVDSVETTTINMDKSAKKLEDSDQSGEISLNSDVDDWLSQSDVEDKTIDPMLRNIDGPTVATSHVYEVSEAVNENPIYTTQNVLFAKEHMSNNSEAKHMNDSEVIATTVAVETTEKVVVNETSTTPFMTMDDHSKTAVIHEEASNETSSTPTTTENIISSTASEIVTDMPRMHNETELHSENVTEHQLLHEVIDAATVSNSTTNATQSELESLKKNAPRLDDDEQYMSNPHDNATEQSEKIFTTTIEPNVDESDDELSVAPLKKSARVNDEVVVPVMENATFANDVKEMLDSNSTSKKFILEDDEDLIASSTEITKSDDIMKVKTVVKEIVSTETPENETNVTITSENPMEDGDAPETTTKLVDIVMQKSTPVLKSMTEEDVSEKVIPLHPELTESNDTSEKVIPLHPEVTESNVTSEKVIPLHPEILESNVTSEKDIPLHPEITESNVTSEKVIPLHPETLESNVTSEKVIPLHSETIESNVTSEKVIPLHSEITESNVTSEKVIPLHPETIESNVSSTSETITTTKEIENITTSEATTKGVTFVDVTEQPKITEKQDVTNVLEEKNVADDQLNDISENETLDDEPSLGVIPLNKPKKIIDKKRDKDLYYKSNEKYEKEGGINKIGGDKITKQSLENDSNQETTTAVHFLANSPLTNQTNNSDSKEGANLQIPSVQNVDVLFYSKCAAGQFQCKNGTSIRDGSYCVALSDRCDSIKDCTDGSDEDSCEVEDCPGNFKCKSGQCLKRHLVCNGILDCDDNSDEENCDSWKCLFDEWSCGGDSKRCIPVPWRCDGRIHCPSGSDEAGCQSTDAVCTNGQFHCAESRMCIPEGWRCDGKVDCMGGDDERFCDCGLDEFKCKTGGGCIPKNQICDGEEQCPDLSDEWDCIRLSNSSNSSQLQTEGATITGNERSLLRIRKNSESWMQVCYSNSSMESFKRVCEYLGYTGLSDVKYIQAEMQDAFVVFKNNSSSQLNVLFDAEVVSSCESGRVASLTCQEFVCGSHLQADMSSGRVVGGDHSDESQWPSVALMYNSILNVACTASVVTPRWLLASRTCILGNLHSDPSLEQERMTGWSVHVGKTTFNPMEDLNNATYVPKRIIPFSGVKYNQVMYNNDLISVKLDRPIILNGTSDAICVADRDLGEKQLCVTAGWGVYQTNVSKSREFRLNYLPLPVMDRQECNSTKHYNGLIREDHICAGYTEGEKAPCYNDEGAPLMCFNDADSKWELHGLLSYHSDCGRTRHPPVFTSLTNKPVSEWLRGIVPSLQLVV